MTSPYIGSIIVFIAVVVLYLPEIIRAAKGWTREMKEALAK